jgi:hypothetical protein
VTHSTWTAGASGFPFSAGRGYDRRDRSRGREHGHACRSARPLADACRKLANAEDDVGISRSKGESAPLEPKVFPGAYHGFDIPRAKPISYLGHHLAFGRRRIRRAKCCVPFSPRISDGRTDGSI